ncbi:vomeronasal type-1 receptor 4-like [Dromiciops gliroides]|uniref:vomeronasal type-1 receptor 4-like n=1 Tax=Dromiciops gliroides TaxID=33562 RepID=UPI001CC6E7D6|nr:vomeronasal type-1 receptor 4-like [Dromiciops gliroides]
MFPQDITLGFLAAITIGTIANVLLFFSDMLYVPSGHKISSLTLIFTQLSLVNITMLLSKGIPQLFLGLGWKNFLNDVGCKVVFYLRRLSEGLSISLTCLLCIFQAITISPSNSKWAQFKVRATQHSTPFCFFCWILNLLLEIPILIIVKGPRSRHNITTAFENLHCTSNEISRLYLIITTFRNVLCFGLMVLASGYMVLFLHNHHQRVQHIWSTSLSSRRHPETRATQIILLLMSTFVSFYSLTSIFILFVHYFDLSSPWALPVAVFLSLCYPTISPFVLMPRAFWTFLIIWAKKGPHSHSGLSCKHGVIKRTSLPPITPSLLNFLEIGHKTQSFLTRKIK